MRGVAVALLVMSVSTAAAVDVGVVPTKLIVIDKVAQASKAKLVYVSKDGAIDKGAGTDPAAIGATFAVGYDSAGGSFLLPVGASDGTSGWTTNKAAVAKYVNKSAPGGLTEAKVGVVKPGKLLKLVGKGLGDVPLDILGSGAPSGSVFTRYCVTNGAEEICHCSAFSACTYKAIAGGTGAKLACKVGLADPSCNAATSTTTTTSSTTTTLGGCGSGFPACGGPCPAGGVCQAFFLPISLGGDGCHCTAPTPCGGGSSGTCPPGFACAILPPDASYLCAPIGCSGGAGFPTCGGTCGGGLECQALSVTDLPFDTCVCAPPVSCDATCGGYACPAGEVCETDLTFGSCGCAVP